MNRQLMKAALIAVVATMLVGTSFGAPGQKKKAAAMACPVCKMDLSKKKDKTHTVAVRLKKGGSVMYCCAGCKMPDSVLVKPSKAKDKPKGK